MSAQPVEPTEYSAQDQADDQVDRAGLEAAQRDPSELLDEEDRRSAQHAARAGRARRTAHGLPSVGGEPVGGVSPDGVAAPPSAVLDGCCHGVGGALESAFGRLRAERPTVAIE